MKRFQYSIAALSMAALTTLPAQASVQFSSDDARPTARPEWIQMAQTMGGGQGQQQRQRKRLRQRLHQDQQMQEDTTQTQTRTRTQTRQRLRQGR